MIESPIKPIANHADSASAQVALETTGSTLTPEQLPQTNQWHWKKLASNTVNTVEQLATLLRIDQTELDTITSVNEFNLRVPLPFVSRMREGDLTDPLLLQVLPLSLENHGQAQMMHDPLNEQQYNVLPGLVHKYESRVLITATTSCPINCRYCFRRHFAYDENRITPANWQPALDYIRADERICEVILSGGEPLLLNDRTLSKLLDEIESIAHIKYIRIHTRFPVVIPQRLTAELCDRLIRSSCQIALVLHANHANEIDEHVASHLKRLANSKVTILNQSVLLKGINDNANTLRELCEKVYSVGVLPYYLHATDPVSGTAHFQVNDTDAQKLALSLANTLPGYLVPTLVREVSGQQGKTRLPLIS